MKQSFSVLGAIGLASAAYTRNPEVNIDGTRYRGVSNTTSGINSFFGIRYAQPPVKQLRWQPPVPVVPQYSGGVVDATAYGPSCIQVTPSWTPSLGPPIPNQHEDCLLLDVLAPIKPASKKLPVMVQIHGGGYDIGNSASYPGDALVFQSDGKMIYVSIQYRLGPLGFLAGDEVEANGSWNVGLLDQRLALEWVQKNIHNFGGDPDKVTIVGGSAGGGSVSMQLILHGGAENPPFRAAIAEYPWWTPMYGRQYLNNQYAGFADAANCTSLKCLRSLSTKEIQRTTDIADQRGYAAGEYAFGLFNWGPVVDGNIIQRHPRHEFEEGHFSKVPILTDRDGYEGIIFSNFSLSNRRELVDDLSELWPGASRGFLTKVLQQYPLSTFNVSYLENVRALKQAGLLDTLANAFSRRQAVFGDALVDCPSLFLAKAGASNGVKTYKFTFDAGSQLHGATVPFLFSTTINPTGESDLNTFGVNATAPGNATVAKYIRDYFVSFAVHLDPNTLATPDGAPTLPEYTTKGQKVLSVSFDDIIMQKDPDENSRCELLGDAPTRIVAI